QAARRHPPLDHAAQRSPHARSRAQGGRRARRHGTGSRLNPTHLEYTHSRRTVSMNRERDTERQKQKLITMGKAKGYVTYDEVNDHMPEESESSDQIDDWLSTVGDEGMEVAHSAPTPAATGQ